MVARHEPLIPIAEARSLADFHRFKTSVVAEARSRFDEAILQANADREVWSYPGYSVSCEKVVLFQVDMNYGGRREGDRWIPNIRERLVCPISQMNNRMRLVAKLLQQEVDIRLRNTPNVYLMERSTSFFRWSESSVRLGNVIGADYKPGAALGSTAGRLADPTVLDLDDACLDVIVSQDVFQYINDPLRGFSECARVLKPGGAMLMTVPLSVEAQTTHERQVELKPSDEGPAQQELSVFRDFGWDILQMALGTGFSDAWLGIYHEPRLGHIGDGLYAFHLQR